MSDGKNTSGATANETDLESSHFKKKQVTILQPETKEKENVEALIQGKESPESLLKTKDKLKEHLVSSGGQEPLLLTTNDNDNDNDDFEDPIKEQQITKSIRDSITLTLAPYSSRRSLICTDRINELRRKAQEAAKQNKIFTIRGCFNSIRSALQARGWVEKLDIHRKHIPSIQVSYDELTQKLPKRKAGETRRHYIAKCERNIMSRFLEHIPIDFLWTNRKEKCDFIDQAKNPSMIINKFHRAPFTTKEGLCNQLKDFHWFFEEGTAELYFPRCFNVWSPEELNEFVENFKLTACIGFIRYILGSYQHIGFDSVFSPYGKIPFTSIDFALKRCYEFLDSCQHNDIDGEDPPKIWEHDWDAFLNQHFQIVNDNDKITSDPQRPLDGLMKIIGQLLEKLKDVWPQYSLDGNQNLWIVKPANKCRGRGILLMDNLKKILNIINPSIASKSRYVVQKYIERPLILFQTKFDIRQWFLITNVQPLVVWIYKESYLRFSSQEYSLRNHHESVHLTNHAIQKKYTNGKRDKRLPSENMWDCYSFQAYLRQIGKHGMWQERIYPGMKRAIVGTMLASQDNMDRRPNTFELFGADFMICENFYPWLIEINSSPDLGATTSVTARMCPQCLEDVVKVVIDRRLDPRSDLGNFELAYRQNVPQTPAYMGLNLYVKGKQLSQKTHNEHHSFNYSVSVRERLYNHSHMTCRQRVSVTNTISKVHRAMPVFNATEMVEKIYSDSSNNTNRRCSTTATNGSLISQHLANLQRFNGSTKLVVPNTVTPNPNLLNPSRIALDRKKAILHEVKLRSMVSKAIMDATNERIRRQRSCGPRLNSGKTESKSKTSGKASKSHKNSNDNNQQQQKSEKDAIISNGERMSITSKPPKCSKSETSLLELLKNSKNSLTLPSKGQKVSSNQDLRQDLLSPNASSMQTRSLSDFGSLSVESSKWKAALQKNNINSRTTITLKSPRQQVMENIEMRETQGIHAIGKALSSSVQTLNSTIPSKSGNGTLPSTGNLLNLSKEMKHFISPRPIKSRSGPSFNSSTS